VVNLEYGLDSDTLSYKIDQYHEHEKQVLRMQLANMMSKFALADQACRDNLGGSLLRQYQQLLLKLETGLKEQ
jgi:hypothetical protein